MSEDRPDWVPDGWEWRRYFHVAIIIKLSDNENKTESGFTTSIHTTVQDGVFHAYGRGWEHHVPVHSLIHCEIEDKSYWADEDGFTASHERITELMTKKAA